jgi:hypothetical protein
MRLPPLCCVFLFTLWFPTASYAGATLSTTGTTTGTTATVTVTVTGDTLDTVAGFYVDKSLTINGNVQNTVMSNTGGAKTTGTLQSSVNLPAGTYPVTVSIRLTNGGVVPLKANVTFNAIGP